MAIAKDASDAAVANASYVGMQSFTKDVVVACPSVGA